VSALDPTRRFSSRVEDYVRYRPSYPPEAVALLQRECSLDSHSTIADIGSGTGFLSKLFLDLGCRVLGVEPNTAMREAGEKILAQYPRFTGIDARAERTGLPDASVDLVAAGQAFHWFAAAEARQEFHRILRLPRWVALIWNEREVTGAFLTGYEALLHRYAPDYAKVDHRQIDATRITAFFGHHAWKLATFRNVQKFDRSGVLGRLHSSSYAPQCGTSNYEPLVSELESLFEAHHQNGQIEFLYQTTLYYGTL
jgi:SAM-dependent methyltransferase